MYSIKRKMYSINRIWLYSISSCIYITYITVWMNIMAASNPLKEPITTEADN